MCYALGGQWVQRVQQMCSGCRARMPSVQAQRRLGVGGRQRQRVWQLLRVMLSGRTIASCDGCLCATVLGALAESVVGRWACTGFGERQPGDAEGYPPLACLGVWG